MSAGRFCVARFINLTAQNLPVDMVTFTEEILNGKLLFLCGVYGVISEYYE